MDIIGDTDLWGESSVPGAIELRALAFSRVLALPQRPPKKSVNFMAQDSSKAIHST